MNPPTLRTFNYDRDTLKNKANLVYNLNPMKPRLSTRWNLTPREAMRLQERLRERVVLEDRFDGVRTVAGADLAFDPATDDAVAGVIVYRFPQLEEVERRMAWRKLRFPYVPGLLSFRESPSRTGGRAGTSRSCWRRSLACARNRI